jgi:hypothetical protein
MHSGRNFDALVGMDSLSKAAFHRTLLRHPKYTQAYLDHVYDIVHDFRKFDIRVLHVIHPKEGGAVQDDEEKKDGEPDPTEQPVEIGSPNSTITDSPSKKNGDQFSSLAGRNGICRGRLFERCPCLWPS